MPRKHDDIAVVFFDFSGVLAEEGFVQGLKEIGRRNGKSPETVLRTATEICYAHGYATGNASEHDFWEAVRRATGITESDTELRSAILTRFVIRPWMLRVVAHVREHARTALLSDHTNWLEELNSAHGFFRLFDGVFNSYREGMSKREPAFFRYACENMHVFPQQALFIDDNPANTTRAATEGLRTITYEGYPAFAKHLRAALPDVALPQEIEAS